MADHLDAPGLTPPGGDKRLDITDVYAFHPPGLVGSVQELEKMVLVININPLSPAGTSPTFSDEAEYKLLVDTDGDADDDIEIEFGFEEPEGGVQEFEIEMEGEGTEIEGEGVTGSVIDLGGGAKVFAGLRDDPFFFDLGVLLGTSGGGTDTFEKHNVSAMVLEVPTAALTPEGSSIAVWGAVEGSGQIDRMGRPTVNTVLIPTARKNLYNESEPEDDVETFTQDIIDTLLAAPFNRAQGAAEFIAGVLLPDILTLDASLPTEFTFFNAGPVVLNGRNLDDDVIDSALRLVFGSDAATDRVPANDKAFLGAFPYLAPPH